MGQHTITLPEPISDFVETRLAEDNYPDLSAYICDLVRRDQADREAALEALRHLLDEAEASGLSPRTGPEIVEAARLEASRQGLLDG